MKKKIVVGNLKMNLLSPVEADRYISLMRREMADKNFLETEIVLCPPVVYLEKFTASFKNDRTVKMGAQNMSWEEKGSYTGEISAPMVKNAGGGYAIIGHSERRKYFGESNETANWKIKVALKNNIIPIICIGETKEERQNDLTQKIIIDQLEGGLDGVSGMNAEKIIYVYEPAWAVGTDDVPTSNEIMSARLIIRKKLLEKFGEKAVDRMRIIYGGSINAMNVGEVCVEAGMDGGLVGRESLMPHEFVKIAEIMDNSQNKS